MPGFLLRARNIQRELERSIFRENNLGKFLFLIIDNYEEWIVTNVYKSAKRIQKEISKYDKCIQTC